jgi:hypothetical protein
MVSAHARREQVIVDLQLESARTDALLAGALRAGVAKA